MTTESPATRWIMLALLFYVRGAMYMQSQVVAPLMPFLQPDLGLSYAQVGFLVGAYFLPGAVIALPGGVAARAIGDRRMLLLCLVLLTAGAALLAVSPTYSVALAARLLSGTGAVMLNVQATKMATDWFAGRELATAMAVITTAWGLGVAVAFTTLGAVGDAYSWRVAIGFVAGLTLLGLILIAVAYRDPPQQAGHVPPAFSWGGLITRWEVGASTLSGWSRMCYIVGLSVFQSFAPNYLVETGTAPAYASLTVSLSTWALLISVPLGGFLTDRWRATVPVIVVGSLGLALACGAVPAAGGATVLFLLVGLVGGIPQGAMNALPGGFLHPASRNLGFAVFLTWSYIGMAVLPWVAGHLQDRSGLPSTPLTFSAGVIAATVVAYGAYLLLMRAWRRSPANGPAT